MGKSGAARDARDAEDTAIKKKEREKRSDSCCHVVGGKSQFKFCGDRKARRDRVGYRKDEWGKRRKRDEERTSVCEYCFIGWGE